MPELAEVEYFRRQWLVGMHQPILKLSLHAEKRIFRGTNTRALRKELIGAEPFASEARGKKIVFRFSGQNWLGLHLGMTGRLSVRPPEFRPDKHDHLILYQAAQALVFTDPRQFGRVRFHRGQSPPDWWNSDVPEIRSAQFTRTFFDDFLDRHQKAPVKAVLLMQRGFSGIGNWMADEILWRARVLPSRRVKSLQNEERGALFRATRFVARESLRLIAADLTEPPRTWLLQQRWRPTGKCPRHRTRLCRAVVGGRTTAWCATCQL